MQRTHIKLANGKFAKTHDEEMKRWRVHFQEGLNCPEPSASLNEEQLHNSLDVSMQDISQDEVIRVINKLKNGKAAGVDEVHPELLKYGEAAVPYFTRLCNQIWGSHTVPAEWRNVIIIPLLKKGDLSECGNWRGITLLSVPEKSLPALC